MGRFYTAIVTDNVDPDELGQLRLIVPELLDAVTELPMWVKPRVAPGAGPSSGWWFIPPVDAVVVVERDSSGELRWSGAGWGDVNKPPAFLAGNYPRRSGFTSPEGASSMALDEDVGLLVLVPDPGDLEGVANYMSMDGSAAGGEWKVGLIAGSMAVISELQVFLMNAAGDTLMLDSDNGILLTHQDGSEYLSLAGGVTALGGTDLQIMGGAVNVVGQGGITLTSDSLGIAPTEPLILGTSFLTDLSTFLTGCVADVALSPGVSAAAGVLLGTVATALAAGAPYLSTVTESE